jgi:hypothetical protein
MTAPKAPKSTTPATPTATPKRIVMECVDGTTWAWEVLFNDKKDTGGLVKNPAEAWCRITHAILERNPEQAKQMAVRLVTADYLVELCEQVRTEGYAAAVADQEAKPSKIKPQGLNDEPTKPEPTPPEDTGVCV